MYEESLKNQINNLLNHPGIMPKQREVLIKFDKSGQKNDGLTLNSRVRQLHKLVKLARAVRKSFTAMTREDIETFLYGLDDLSPATLDQHKIAIKKFFKWLKQTDDYPDIVKWIKINNRKTKKLPENLLTPSEVRSMIDAGDNPRDRALISVLYESACRLGEIVGLKQKDVNIDQYGAVIMVDGKTGQRRIRLIDSAPDLILWLNNHPKKNQDMPLFCNALFPDKAVKDKGIQDRLKIMSKRAGLTKKVHPHLLRHSRLTALAKDFTESELKIMAGWAGDSRMAGTYIHLSGADIEQKQLERAGLIDKGVRQKEDNILKPKNCPRCPEVNPATARFCNKCGAALDLWAAKEIDDKTKQIPEVFAGYLENPEFLKAFTDAVAKVSQKK